MQLYSYVRKWTRRDINGEVWHRNTKCNTGRKRALAVQDVVGLFQTGQVLMKH